MIYNQELVQHKKLKFLSSGDAAESGLQVFSNQQQELQTVKYLRSFIGDKSTIHGMQYVAGTSVQRNWVRFIWAIVVVCAVVGFIDMYVILSERHNQQQLKTVVETSQFPVYKIAFPAVAVCPWNHINWIRFKAAEKRFLPPHPDLWTRAAFHELLAGLEQLNFGRFDHLSKLVVHMDALRTVDGVSITELAQFLSFRCDELFVECVFDKIPMDCCKLFVPERTEKGVCLVFNSLISEESRKKNLADELYPWRVGKGGEESGLQFTIRFNSSYQRPGNFVPFIVNVMIKESQQWSVQMLHTLYPFTHNSISITPQITMTSENTRRVKPAKRHCLFSDEKASNYEYEKAQGLPYNRQNCIAECQHYHLLRVCNCTLPLFLPTTANNHRECRALDFVCIYNNRDIFSYIKVPTQDDCIKDDRRGLNCDCINNCNSLVYLLTLNARQLINFNRSIPTIKADIHFGQDTMTQYATELEYTLMDLLANFGGILGLCLGASILSLAEILYVFFKAVWLLKAEKGILWQKVKSLRMFKTRKIAAKK